MKYEKQVSINITAHREGYYLYKSLKSIEEGCQYASSRGLTDIEINLHLDDSDDLTERIARDYDFKFTSLNIFTNRFCDSGESRNFLISKSSGKYILFHDGDDIFTANFIYEAYRLSEDYKKPTVVSAGLIVDFDTKIRQLVYKPESTLTKPYRKTALVENNLFISQNFVHSSIYKDIKYGSSERRFGFEDWHWNAEVVAAGYDYQIAGGTTFFYRKKNDGSSLLNSHSKMSIRPSTLFNPRNFVKFKHKKYEYTTVTQEPLVRKRNVRTIGREVSGRVTGSESLVYNVLRRSYNLLQKGLAPLVHKVRRHKVTLSLDVIESGHFKNLNLSRTQLSFWKKVNKIEPLILPSEGVLKDLRIVKYEDEHLLSSKYYELCSKYEHSLFTDIIFVPWISKGGADLAMIDLIKEISGKGRTPLVVTTSGVDSVWKAKVEAISNATILESHYDLAGFDHLNLKTLFLRIIQNWNIQTLTIMNSAIGFEMVAEFGKYMDGCSVVVHSFAIPTEKGLFIEAFPSFPLALPYIDFIVTDSNVHSNLLSNIYGFNLKHIVKIALPVTKGVTIKHTRTTKRILFANRLAREKQPDIAIKVAHDLKELGVELDIYGTKDEDYCDNIDFNQLVQDCENVHFKGSFNGVETLDFDKYDICFMPSLYEGIPRIAIDSVQANLFIVSSGVGGLKEIVHHGKNGFIVDDPGSISDYVDSIKRYYDSDSLQALDARRKLSADIMKAHSMERYRDSIKVVYNL